MSGIPGNYALAWAAGCAALAGVGAGCAASGLPGESPDAAPASSTLYSSGSRLRTETLVSAGGATAFAGWRDRLLDLDCSFALAEDGAYHCMPPLGGGLVFLDPDCTQPALSQFSPCVTTGFHVSTNAATNCADYGAPTSPSRAWKITGRHEGAAYVMSGGSCLLTQLATTLADIVAVPAATFVKAEVSQQSVGSAVSLGFMNGEDGSRQALFLGGTPLVDESRNSPCGPNPIGQPTEYLCAPWSTFFYQFYWADSECATTPVVVMEAPPCPLPGIVQTLNPEVDGRFQGTALHSVAGTTTGPVFYGSPGYCIPWPVTNQTVLVPGPPIPNSDFPMLTPITRGHGALTSIDLVTSSDRTLVQGFLFFNAAGDWCTPQPYRGGFVCLPPSLNRIGGDGTAFADDDCTVPLILDGSAHPSSRRWVDYGDTVCPPTIVGLYGLGGPSSSPVYHRRINDGSCAVAGMTPETARVAVAVDPATEPTLTLRIE